MSKFLCCLVWALVSFSGVAVFGQKVEFQNTLDSAIDLILTDKSTGTETTLRIAKGAIRPFNVAAGSAVFDLRIMPLDKIGTGFRLDGRDLAAQAVNRKGKAVPLGGIVEKRCYCRRTCRRIFRRWETYCVEMRTAAFIDEFDASGGIQRVTAPLSTY